MVHSGNAVMNVVLFGLLAQSQYGSVMLRHLFQFPRLVIDGDRFSWRHDIEVIDRFIVLTHVVETLGRTGVIVERDAGGNAIDKRRTAMYDCPLD